jgi:hypothetical protein
MFVCFSGGFIGVKATKLRTAENSEFGFSPVVAGFSNKDFYDIQRYVS